MKTIIKTIDRRINRRIRRLCRDIHHRADDRVRLQTLVVRLQEVLRQQGLTEVRYDIREVGATAPADDPFDKIMIA